MGSESSDPVRYRHGEAQPSLVLLPALRLPPHLLGRRAARAPLRARGDRAGSVRRLLLVGGVNGAGQWPRQVGCRVEAPARAREERGRRECLVVAFLIRQSAGRVGDAVDGHVSLVNSEWRDSTG